MKQDGALGQPEESQQLLSPPVPAKGEISPKSGLSVTILELTPNEQDQSEKISPQRRDSNTSDTYAPSSK
ncbi:hypothetical protein O3M35_006104 [Rhynocoris fuscipes]|uniref:Uncharacterized protein n=1 Tax=Rhynocoris fuscipes TaxID=488301 RepID=A0AAW1DHZ1_9HEMI